jgi:hypothetical protein
MGYIILVIFLVIIVAITSYKHYKHYKCIIKHNDNLTMFNDVVKSHISQTSERFNDLYAKQKNVANKALLCIDDVEILTKHLSLLQKYSEATAIICIKQKETNEELIEMLSKIKNEYIKEDKMLNDELVIVTNKLVEINKKCSNLEKEHDKIQSSKINKIRTHNRNRKRKY